MPYLVKDIFQLVLCQGRALDIFHGAQLLRHPIAIFLPNRLHLLFGKLLSHDRVIPQICLRANNQAGHTGAVMVHLREPLLPNVFEGRWRSDGEAHQEYICLGV